MKTPSSVCLLFRNSGQDLVCSHSFFPSCFLVKHTVAVKSKKKRKKTVKKAKEGEQMLPLAQAMLMHVSHHICAKVVEEEWRVKPLKMRYFISPGVYIFHPPFLHSPLCLSALSFFSPVAERADCGALSFCPKQVSVLCIVPLFFGMMRKAWNNNVWGRSETPLFSVSSLPSLPVLASPDDSDALCRSPAGVGHLTPSGAKCLHIAVHALTHWEASVNACKDMSALKHFM